MNPFAYRHVIWAIVVSILIIPATGAETQAPPGDFKPLATQAITVLKNNCFSCHNETKHRGGLVLENRDALLRGSDNGSVVTPGAAEESQFARLLLPSGDPHMPPKKQLPDSQITLLRTWIDAGLPWADLPSDSPNFIDPSALTPLPPAYQPSFTFALSPDGKRLALARGNAIDLYDLTKTEPVRQHRWQGARDAVQSIAWSADGQWLAAGEFRRILLWKDPAAEPSLEISDLNGRITALEFTPDNQQLVAADGMAGQSCSLRIIALGQSQVTQTWTAHSDTILDLEISPDGNLLASAGIDKLVRLWSLSTTEAGETQETDPNDLQAAEPHAAPLELAKLEGHTGHIWALAFNTNGTLLASAGADKQLKIWDVTSREQKHTVQGYPDTVTGLSWMPNSAKIAASLADGTIRIADETKNRIDRTWSGGSNLLAGIAISSTANPVTYANALDGTLYVWNHDGKLQHKLTNPHETAPEPSVEPIDPPPVVLSFTSDILPILSKAGCNAGKCHAKPDGQNGFKLSVFAYDPKSDYSEIVHDARGRRLFAAHPAESLLLKKPTLAMDHEGGQRIEPGSEEYHTLKRWIEQGMPYTRPNEPALEMVRIDPAENSYSKGAEKQLRVEARYSDRSLRDVTQLAEFDSTEKEIARVGEDGLVRVGPISGEAVVIARFMGMVAISRVTVPRDRRLNESLYRKLPVINFIDDLAYERFRKLGIYPSDGCTDAEFIRRVSLDITGTLPATEEARAFLADQTPEKRSKLIDRLLEHPAYADHWASKWADLIRPNPDRVGVKSVFMLDQWLRDSFRQNKRYDQFTREILSATGSTHQNGPTVVFRDRREPSDLTTLVSQVFLGVRLECAKCHHHPNEKWSQDDFYQFAAYFGEIKRKGKGISPPISGDFEVIYHAPGGTVKHPLTGAAMKPKPPDGPLARIPDGSDPRHALADWTTRPDNPFFARAVVNRIWAEFFGRGLVDPVDDFRASNPPSNPALLDALSDDFVRRHYDLKHLMRRIAMSHLYQLSSLPNEFNVADTRNFSRSYRRRLPAEVLADAVSDVTNVPASFPGLPTGARAKATWNYKIGSELLDAFGRPNSSSDCPCERDTRVSVVQALHLMNSNDLQSRIAHPTGRAAQLASSELSSTEIITELYLAALNRYPAPEEIIVAGQAFTAPEASRRTAVEDILWALLNSAEFVFNH